MDVTAGTVRVAVSLDPHGKIGPTKNRKTRTVPVGPETVARMRRWLLASGRPADGSRVFDGWLYGPWDRVRAAAELTDPQPRFHDLRHTAATFLLAAGLRSHAVAQILGHDDAGWTTEGRERRDPASRTRASAGRRCGPLLTAIAREIWRVLGRRLRGPGRRIATEIREPSRRCVGRVGARRRRAEVAGRAGTHSWRRRLRSRAVRRVRWLRLRQLLLLPARAVRRSAIAHRPSLPP